MPSPENLLSRLAARPGATTSEISDAEAALSKKLPEDYVSLLRRCDGAEGPVGEEGYLILWPIPEVLSRTQQFANFEQFHDLILVGTDGGGEALCVAEDGRYSMVPFVGSAEDRVEVGQSIESVLARLATGSI